MITHVNLFEAVIEKFLHSESVFDNFQFGFKPDLLTSLVLSLSLSLSLRFNGHFPGEPGLAGAY